MTQTWSAETYEKNARYVSDLGMPIVEWLDPKAGEHILDLGCGDGALTAKLQALGCKVIGVDSSPDFVQAAQSLGLDARLLDGHQIAFTHEFDAVFSNAALHWMKRPDRVIAGVWQSLKPGGRFVGEFGGNGNISTIQAALHSAFRARDLDPDKINPWYFPTIEDYRDRLEARGFSVNEMALISRPTPLPTEIGGWLATFANPYTEKIAPAERDAFLAEVISRLEPTLRHNSGHWVADYVRLRFSATKPLRSL